MPPAWSSASSTWPRLERGCCTSARALNDEGIASPAGKLWSKNGIHFILRNEVYTGTLIWGANAKDKADPIRIEKAFPAIISKAKSQRVNSLMRSRAPKIINPRRVGSSHLLSGLLKCKACNRALSAQVAKSGQFSHYVCQSIMKRGKDACESPRLNARRFEELVVDKIRSNVLTEGNVPRPGEGRSRWTAWPASSAGGWRLLRMSLRM